MNKLIAGLLSLAAVVGAAFTVNDRFESKAEANTIHERMAADEEVARLRTSLQIVDIKIARYREIAAVRPLTEAEQIDLRSLEQERAVLLARMAAKA